MFNYIRAELYKVTHRKANYFLLAWLLVCELLLLAAGWEGNRNGTKITFENYVSLLMTMLVAGLYAAIIACNLVFSDQYKLNTLKNEVSFGLPRLRIYFGKFLSAAILAVVLLAVVVGVYLGVAYLIFPKQGGEATQIIMTTLGMALLSALPLYLGALGVAMALSFSCRIGQIATLGAVGIFSVLSPVFKLLFLLTENKVFLKLLDITLVETLMKFDGTWTHCGYAWLIGMCWMVPFLVIGCAVFRKKEIN